MHHPLKDRDSPKGRLIYLLSFFILLTAEIFIALYVRDGFFRPYFGDFLVVILLYCFFRSVLDVPAAPLTLAVLLFSFGIEAGQYFHLVDLLGLSGSAIARTVIGTGFEWLDLLAYTSGAAFILLIESARK